MPLNYNDPISFGRGGSAQTLNCTGVDFSEWGGSWTDAPVASLDIDLPYARQDVLLELDAEPFLVDRVLPAQKMFIYLGGLFIGFCTLRAHAIKSFRVPRANVSGRTNCLTLVIPTATSPQELGLSGDERQLGVYLKEVSFRTTV